ncbi:hypothetical protein [Cerasibacillus terrae]|nr:hypothetical protein [Cerasibacillus terrae]
MVILEVSTKELLQLIIAVTLIYFLIVYFHELKQGDPDILL